MNLTLWVWGRYGLAVSALILLGVPAVAAPSAMKISQGVSQQSGENPAARRAYDIMSGRSTMIKLLPPATNRNESNH